MTNPVLILTKRDGGEERVAVTPDTLEYRLPAGSFTAMRFDPPFQPDRPHLVPYDVRIVGAGDGLTVNLPERVEFELAPPITFPSGVRIIRN